MTSEERLELRNRRKEFNLLQKNRLKSQKQTTRREYDEELLHVFKVFYTEYLADNLGYLTIFDYLQGRFNFTPKKWVKIARKAKLTVMEREGVIYIKA